jgi:CheY-like chemotaxis protein
MAEVDLKGRHALVVDDDPFVRSIVVRMLRDLGEPKIDLADHGSEATAILAFPGKNIDFALVDFMMPSMNGLELLKAIRTGRARCRRDLPVAMLTAISDKDLVGKALALDVNAFLLKPTSQQVLGLRIERMLSEEPYVQDPEVYEAIEVPMAPQQRQAAVVLPPSPPAVPAPAPRRPERTMVEPVRPRTRVGIDELTENATLAADLINQRGICLLRKGVMINRRILSRLRDLGDLKEIDHVWVYVREPASSV